ncbi:FAD synthase [Galdieria sulphuraria]|nr:FAD synthase [Galdieria sulphuraria]
MENRLNDSYSVSFEDNYVLYQYLVSDEMFRIFHPSFVFKVRESLQVLLGALRLYGTESLALSFNGGKDATVVMHLLRAAVGEHSQGREDSCSHINAVYFTDSDYFEQVELFVKAMRERYHLNLILQEGGFLQGLKIIVEERNMKSFTMGTRRSDPDGKHLEHFTPSSQGWPPFMRVNPILSWSYGEVWKFLLSLKLPYCDLYDQGYTSIGRVSDTQPNPLLRIDNSSFWPAYYLSHEEEERAGRKLDKRRLSLSRRGPIEDGPRTAALVVIGNELLKGTTQDINAHKASIVLREMGIDLRRVVFIPDEVEVIASEIRSAFASMDIVITSGGIGPTHDDVTFQAMAHAFSVPLERCEELEEVLIRTLGSSFSSSCYNMTKIPQGAELLYERSCCDCAEESQFPIVKLYSVYNLPGIPQYFLKSLQIIKPYIETGYHFCGLRIELNVEEIAIADILAEFVQSHPNLEIGCYPIVSYSNVKTVLILEAHNRETLEKCFIELKAQLPSDAILAERGL